MQVWKYELAVTDRQELEVPKGARFLHVDTQRGTPCLWAIVDPQAEKEPRYIRIAGTGHDVTKEECMEYLGTFMIVGGNFVGHVFEADPVFAGTPGI